MGQCCGKIGEGQAGVEEQSGQGGSQPSLAPLVSSEVCPQPQDEHASSTEQDVSPDSHEHPPPTPRSPTPEAQPRPSPSMDKHLHYPILQDNSTIQYIQDSKVLVILKGLPGSGKSYISSKLKHVYPGATVCSADFYFMKDGEYKFNVDKLKLAHEACHQSAKKAAVSGAPVIIIDNTNLQAWTYKYYLRLSKDHHYTPLIMEPQTPWSKNTQQLATMNSHGLSKEMLDQKLKKYELTLPLYYWWFLNEEDSSQILAMAQNWLKKALQVKEFMKDFNRFSKLSSIEDILSYYKKNEGHGDYKVLHATASVTRRGKTKNAKEYMAKKAVKDYFGKVFTLHIIGFVLTPRTFSARLRLGEEALEVWNMDDHETESEDTLNNTSGKAGQQSPKEDERVSIGNTSLRSGSCPTTVRPGESLLHKARYYPTADRGSRAHLTLGCAPKVSARITGLDLVKVVTHEQRRKNETPEQSIGKRETFSLPEGELRTYGDGIWVIYPEKEINVDSLFSAFY